MPAKPFDPSACGESSATGQQQCGAMSPAAHLSSSSSRAPARLAPARTSVPLPSSSTCCISDGEWCYLPSHLRSGRWDSWKAAGPAAGIHALWGEAMQSGQSWGRTRGAGESKKLHVVDEPHQDERALGHVLQHVPAVSKRANEYAGKAGQTLCARRLSTDLAACMVLVGTPK